MQRRAKNLAFCIFGGIAAIVGAFACYEARTRSVKALGMKDAFIAIPEDIVAICIAVLAVCVVR